jgi:hypothetical protein
VLSVNGHSVVGVDHYDAVEVLKRSGYKLVLVVTREVPRLVPVTAKVGTYLQFPGHYYNNRLTVCVFQILTNCLILTKLLCTLYHWRPLPVLLISVSRNDMTDV